MRARALLTGIGLFTASVAMTCIAPLVAAADVDGDYSCTISGQFAVASGIVQSGSTCEGIANIPSGATSISESAFFQAPMTRVNIPSSVQSIADNAFYLSSIVTVNFATRSQLTSLGTQAFAGTAGLTSINLPRALTTLGTNVFANSGITSINIPAAVSVIPDYAFYFAANLASVTFAAGSQVTRIGISAFSDTASLQTIDLPDGLLTIDISAFSYSGLEEITIPASVTSIKDSAFTLSPNLESVTFESGSQLNLIEQSAFSYTALTEIYFPEGVTTIPGDAVSSVPTLTRVSIPSTVTSIGSRAFAGATNLTQVLFTEDSALIEIGNYAFIAASSLTHVTFPASLATIGTLAIHDMASLEKIGFLGDRPSVVNAESVSHLQDGAEIIVRHDNTTYGDLSTNPVWESAGTDTEISIVPGHTISFDDNGADGGHLPSPKLAQTGTDVMLPTNYGGLTREGKVFIGWNTEADGSGDRHEPNDEIVMPDSDQTLYAMWGVRAAATTKPSITGKTQVGQTLNARKGTWRGSPTLTFRYQWYSCSAKVKREVEDAPRSCTVIRGATREQLKLVRNHLNKFITVSVTGTSLGSPSTRWFAKSTTTKVS